MEEYAGLSEKLFDKDFCVILIKGFVVYLANIDNIIIEYLVVDYCFNSI